MNEFSNGIVSVVTQHDRSDVTYLSDGTPRQRAAYRTLQRLEIFENLHGYSPTLVGTVPIDVDVAGSDLDIICEAADLDAFARHVTSSYGQYDGFRLWQRDIRGVPSVVARFRAKAFPVEVFAQPQPVTEQHAYRHMIVEARLLQIGGEAARRGVRRLKRAGYKTEPAFARYFGLDGDPYEALLALYPLDDAQLRAQIGEPTDT